MATPPSGMTPSNCPIACVGTVSYADGAATSGDNEVQVAIRNPTIEVKVSDSTSQSVYQENDQRNDQELDDEQSPELREAQVHRVNVLGFKSTVSIGTYSGAFSESLSSFVRQFKDQMRAADAEASETAQVYAFLTFLVGNARDRAEEFLNEKADATVDQLVADLKATFESELTSKLKIAQFNKCRQEHGESIEKYYNRVRVLAAQAFRCEDRQVMEKKARDAFLNGLDDTIRYNVKDKDPKSCKEAFDEAIRQEILREDRLASQQYAPTVALLEEMRSLKNDWYNSQEGQNNWHNNQDEEKSRRFNACRTNRTKRTNRTVRGRTGRTGRTADEADGRRTDGRTDGPDGRKLVRMEALKLMHRVHFTEEECTPERPRDYSIVLGNDLLSQLPQFSIDYIRSMFHMGEDVLPIGNRHITCNPEVLDVNVLEESVVSAKNESFISCSMPTTAVVSNAGYLIRSQCLTQKSLLTAPLQVKSKNFRILVTNPTDFAVTLPPGTKAAEAIELCEDEIKSI
uniref:Retrotrans_gag domain-containing protein n=1 Tax=Caenorhabditis japonica TaxID=281687 RepID=A0A8R1IA33_CAEJA